MKIVLVTGGARSGKSQWAQSLALTLGGDDVTVLATAEARDEEMAQRITQHQRDRPPAWATVEEPLLVAEALAKVATSVVLLDCLTILVSNILLAQVEAEEDVRMAAVEDALNRLLDAASDRAGSLIIVTNEVGCGIVPAAPIARWYRDALGSANRQVATIAEEVVLMVCGTPLFVKVDRKKRSPRLFC